MQEHQYLYTLGAGQPISEFTGGLNVVSARQVAEKRFGPGGRLFREVVQTEAPLSVEDHRPERAKKNILVLHP